MTGLIPARKRGRPRRTQEDVAPTPETLAKLQRDQLSDFLKQGELTPNQKRAAPKIYSFYLALKRGMAQQSRLEIGPSVPARSQPQAPLERLSDAESESWCTVYRPWAGGVSRQTLSRRPKLTALSLVGSIVKENQSPEFVSSAFDVPRPRVLSRAKARLDGYIA